MNKEIEILVDGKPTKMKLPPDMQDSKIVIENGKVFVETGVVDYINNLKEENQRLNDDIKILLKENKAKEKVIIKQNNVLNELEKWIKENCFFMAQDFIDSIIVPNEDKIIYVEDVLDKLNELKESGK